MKTNALLSFIFVLSIISFSSWSQTLEELDKRNGFQSLKFNTPLSSYSRYNPVKIKEGSYLLKNISELKIGDYPLESVELYFRDDKLVRIKVTMDDQDRMRNEAIFNALIKAYGRYSFHRSSSTYIYTSEMTWKAKMVTLIYNFSSYKEGSNFVTKITLTYSYSGENIEVDLTKDL
jgi:hypothetical protein